MHAIAQPVVWLRRHDPGFNALRRAARAALIMPLTFALGTQLIGNASLATFAALGSFAMLLLVDFTGTMRDRLQAQGALAVVTSAFICLGTIASFNAWVAALSMAVVGFVVVFAGVVSSQIAAATTPLLLSYILPVTLSGNMHAIPDRLAGWTLSSVVSLIAIVVLWPAEARGPTPQTVCDCLSSRGRSLAS